MRGDWPDEAMAELKPDRRTAVVTLTHDPKLDDPALQAALRSPAFYIGALGSREDSCRAAGAPGRCRFHAEQTARVHGPVGLSIGALSPAEIAVSGPGPDHGGQARRMIFAEMDLAVGGGRAAGP